MPRALVVLCFLSATAAAAAPPPPGTDVLMAVRTGGAEIGPCPLQSTDVAIEVAGDTVRARVTQTFGNPFAERIEAVYAFPLSETAAVNGYEMRIGDRVVRGVLKKREQAKRDYERARDRGESA